MGSDYPENLACNPLGVVDGRGGGLRHQQGSPCTRWCAVTRRACEGRSGFARPRSQPWPKNNSSPRGGGGPRRRKDLGARGPRFALGITRRQRPVSREAHAALPGQRCFQRRGRPPLPKRRQSLARALGAAVMRFAGAGAAGPPKRQQASGTAPRADRSQGWGRLGRGGGSEARSDSAPFPP